MKLISDKNFNQLQHNIKILSEEKETLKGHLQHAITNVEELQSKKWTRNRYKSYKQQVTAISKKYECRDDFGNGLTQLIVKARAAFAIAGGINLIDSKKEENATEESKEMQILKAFYEFNDLDRETVFDWAKEVEIEGKFLCRLIPAKQDEENQKENPFGVDMFKARFIPYSTTNYKVHEDPEDYKIYEKVTYRDTQNSSNKEVTISKEDFVYSRFGGRTSKVNETPPVMASCLEDVEDIDLARRDWREINKFYYPTPVFEMQTEEGAVIVKKYIKDENWKVGKALVIAGGEYKLVGLPPGALDSINDEIIMSLKFLSGKSSIPVHFFGFPELLSNRATADNLLELMFIGVSDIRLIWKGFYEELNSKVLSKYKKEEGQGDFDINRIKVELPLPTEKQMQELRETWLPLWLQGAITLDTFLSKIVGIDAEKEKERHAIDRKENLITSKTTEDET